MVTGDGDRWTMMRFGGDNGVRPMAQTQSTVMTAHGEVEGGRSQGGVEADVNWGMTDGGGADGSQGADGELMEQSNVADTGGLGYAAVTSI